MLPCPPVVVLRARSDLEGAHVLGDVHAREVEGEGREPSLLVRVGRRGKVAMPRLELRSLERDVEPELDDLVVGAEDHLGHRRDERMRDEVHEAADRLRVDLHVPASWTASDRAAGTLNRLPERGHHVLAHPLGPVGRERPLRAGDAILGQAPHVCVGIEGHGDPIVPRGKMGTSASRDLRHGSRNEPRVVARGVKRGGVFARSQRAARIPHPDPPRMPDGAAHARHSLCTGRHDKDLHETDRVVGRDRRQRRARARPLRR